MHTRAASLAVAMALAAGIGGCVGGPEEGVLRLGFFPNLTHAQALVGSHTGLFQEALGDTQLRVQTFNAGPAAIMALLSGHVDVVYVGPTPTVNAIEAAGPDSLRIVAGAASGGVSFVVRPGFPAGDGADWSRARFAAPQLGNTQDVALKHYLLERGYATTDRGGPVQVINAPNPYILALFQQGEVDGAWIPEPWVTRLVREGGAEVLLQEESLWPEGSYVTTHIVTTPRFAAERGEDLRRLLQAHVELTRRLSEDPAPLLADINAAIESHTGQRMGEETLVSAITRIRFTHDPLPPSFLQQFEHARELGFVRGKAPPAERVYELAPLADALQEAGLPPLQAGRGVRLRYENVGHTFSRSRRAMEAVRNFNLDVPPGEFVVLLGPSGCGKSTVLSFTAGLESPTSGRVEVDGKAVSGPGPDRMMVFQKPTLFPWLNVQKNVEFGLARAGVGPAERRERARELLRRVQLAGFERHLPHQLSGGMQQRVALARSLALEPKVLLLDEPFAALDALTREDLQDQVERSWMQDRPTTVFVTHDVHEAARLADRIVIMSHRPGTVKAVIPIREPRPRDGDADEVVGAARQARAVLADEVQWAREEQARRMEEEDR
ncbi:MAG TPA: ATP-binding cassette domain-containing protein [Candidatus Thermoplasmatota archaeon]|nr:ATP-binding cassette domain-containing protein [Candidatus Thermoplasmatota archaeon]